MTAFWITLACLVALVLAFATWRLRRASKLLGNILTEELPAPTRNQPQDN